MESVWLRPAESKGKRTPTSEGSNLLVNFSVGSEPPHSGFCEGGGVSRNPHWWEDWQKKDRGLTQGGPATDAHKIETPPFSTFPGSPKYPIDPNPSNYSGRSTTIRPPPHRQFLAELKKLFCQGGPEEGSVTIAPWVVHPPHLAIPLMISNENSLYETLN